MTTTRCFLCLLTAAALAFALGLAGGPAAPAGAEEAPRVVYQKIEIPWPTAAQSALLAGHPDLEAMGFRAEESVTFLSRPAVTEALRAQGFDVKVVSADLEAEYASQLLGSGFGDFYTYSEAVAAMDSLHAAFPSITTAKFSIGTTIQGRTIWAMKVSDNPDVDENEPEVLFDALHHAREPATVSTVLGFVRHLGENYGVDPEVTFVVNQREIWVVPVVNPDGYVYNETTNPGGGGLWRKNRRDNPGACDGVDLNRNYGFQWGGAGADADPCSDVYRGASAFSEPEIQAMRNFIQSRSFVTADSYHSVVPVILFPWGYTTTHSAHHATYSAIAAERARENAYPYGNAGEVLYLASGVAFDWAYGDTISKPRCFGFTTEVSGGDFWPLESAIPGIVAENIYSNMYLSLIAGAFVRTQSVAVNGGNGDGALDPGESDALVFTVKNEGVLSQATNVQITLSSDDPYIQILDAKATLGLIGAGGTDTNGDDPLEIQVDGSAPQGHAATFSVLLTWGAAASNLETVTLTVGELPLIASDSFEAGNNGWSQDPSHSATTGAWTLIDPVGTTWQPENDATPAPGTIAWITAQNPGGAIGTDDVDGGISALRSPVWNLAGYQSVRLNLNWFHGQRDQGGDAGDFFRLSLSNDGGASYPVNLVSIGDVTTGPSWNALSADLEDYLPLTSQMRLRIQAADGTASGDIIEGGLDDLLLADGGSGNSPPGAPTLASPPHGGTVGLTPTLTVNNAVDPESDPLTYGFRVYSDAQLTTVVASVDGVASGVGQTAWTVAPALAEGTYWWRAYAADAGARGLFMTKASFDAEQATDVAGAPASRFALGPATPNPFAAGTQVRFSLPREGRVRADVFDTTGRQVRGLYRGWMASGPQALAWDGRDEAGAPAAAGVYYLLLRTDGELRTLKLTLVR